MKLHSYLVTRVPHWFWRVTQNTCVRVCVYECLQLASFTALSCRYRNKQHPQTDRLHAFVSAWIPQWQRCDIPVAVSQTDSHIPPSFTHPTFSLTLFLFFTLSSQTEAHSPRLSSSCIFVFCLFPFDNSRIKQRSNPQVFLAGFSFCHVFLL